MVDKSLNSDSWKSGRRVRIKWVERWICDFSQQYGLVCKHGSYNVVVPRLKGGFFRSD